MSLKYWSDLYHAYKDRALCLDIEVTSSTGPISLVGLYKPKNGPLDAQFYIRGQNLTTESLRAAFSGCKVLLVYNGLSWDIPRIKKQFPGAIPEDIKVIDLYLFARKLGLGTNLKDLERQLGIPRAEHVAGRRRIAVKLWKRYKRYNDEGALQTLLDYNQEDAGNLYALAEALTELVYQKLP